MRLEELVNFHALPVAPAEKIECRAERGDAAGKLVRKQGRVFISRCLARDGENNRKEVFRAMADFAREEAIPVAP